MRTKLVILIAASLVAALPMAAAQNASQNTEGGAGPGFVTPNSAIYGLEVAYDNAAVSIGLKKAEKVAQERAAEAEEMARRGNYKGAQKAANNMAKVAERVKGNQSQGLQRAEQQLQRVMENAPEEAQQGLQTALENTQRARENMENRTGKGQAPKQPRTEPNDVNVTSEGNASAENNVSGDSGSSGGASESGAEPGPENTSGSQPENTNQ